MKYYREIDLSSLPKTNNGNIRWKESKGKILPFKFDDISSEIHLLDYKKIGKYSYMKIEIPNYTHKETWLNTNSVKNCNIQDIVNTIRNRRKDLIKYIVDENNYDLTIGSHKRIRWRCLNCGREKFAMVHDVVNEGFSCPVCSTKISYPEKFMYVLLKQLNIDFMFQLTSTTFPWVGSFRYDFYIPSLKCIIETNGAQHYKKVGNLWKSLDNQIKIDKKKKELALENGIQHYIEINCSIAKFGNLKKSIINSELPNILNFNDSEVDWNKCNDELVLNKNKSIYSFYNKKLEENESYDLINEIMRKFNINKDYLKQILRKGIKNGWCKYHKCIDENDCGKKYEYIQVKDINHCYINVFKTIKEAAVQMKKLTGKNFSRNGISQCMNKLNDYNGYYFSGIKLKGDLFMNIDNAYSAGRKVLYGDYSQYTPTGKSYFVRNNAYGKLPQVGAVQYNYIGSLGRVGHVAIVEKCYIDNTKRVFTVQTIEGNTSSKSWERNGGCVARKTYTNIPFDSVGKGKENHIDGFGYPAYGDGTCDAQEVINAAQAEIGYIEKASKSQIGDLYRSATETEKTANKGLNNYTKYGAWYGQNGVAWCQQFVSWVFYQACKAHLEKKSTGWVKDASGKWYYRINGQNVKNDWKQIGGRWYVFDGVGAMITGWFKGSTGWYYLNPSDGAMLSGQWLNYKNEWYYLSKTGLMVTDGYVTDTKGRGYCYLDSEGKWDGNYDKVVPRGIEIVS